MCFFHKMTVIIYIYTKITNKINQPTNKKLLCLLDSKTKQNKKENTEQKTKWHQWTKSGHNAISQLKHPLCNVFRRAIQNHVSSMADFQSLDDRYCLKTAFSIELRLVTSRQQARPCGLTWKACVCVWTKSMLTWTNNTLVIHIISAVEPNKSGLCLISSWFWIQRVNGSNRHKLKSQDTASAFSASLRIKAFASAQRKTENSK